VWACGRVGVWSHFARSEFASRVHSQARSYVDTPLRPHAHTPTRPHAHTPTRPYVPTPARRNVSWRCFLRDRAEGTKVSRDRDYNVQYSGRNMK
jgi:hypothetical protein